VIRQGIIRFVSAGVKALGQSSRQCFSTLQREQQKATNNRGFLIKRAQISTFQHTKSSIATAGAPLVRMVSAAFALCFSYKSDHQLASISYDQAHMMPTNGLAIPSPIADSTVARTPHNPGA
jgi:hypothetical protein